MIVHAVMLLEDWTCLQKKTLAAVDKPFELQQRSLMAVTGRAMSRLNPNLSLSWADILANVHASTRQPAIQLTTLRGLSSSEAGGRQQLGNNLQRLRQNFS